MTATEKITRVRSDSPAARFRKGDRVAIGPDVADVSCRGRVCVVRRVFWGPAGGGQSAGWVCEVDVPSGPARFKAFWDRLLGPVRVEEVDHLPVIAAE